MQLLQSAVKVSVTRDYADLDPPALNGNSSTIVKSTFMKSLISINKLYFVIKSILQNYSMNSNCSNTVIPGFTCYIKKAVGKMSEGGHIKN